MTDGDKGESTGFTRYVTSEEFKQFSEQSIKDRGRLNNALWGADGTNGIIKDINDLKMWIKFLGIIGGIISPILTAVLVRYIIGGI